jgi:hypothetical protein
VVAAAERTRLLDLQYSTIVLTVWWLQEMPSTQLDSEVQLAMSATV